MFPLTELTTRKQVVVSGALSLELIFFEEDVSMSWLVVLLSWRCLR